MEEFKLEPSCSKCGHTNAEFKFLSPEGQDDINVECLRLECRICLYAWYMKTWDAK